MPRYIKKYPLALLKRLYGFSLAEMSIVMVVVGLIASSAISVAISSDYATKRDETESKMIRIDEALAGYLATNHRLPCPADGTLGTTSTNFGIEVAGGGNRAAAPTCTLHNFSVANIRAGVIPVRTLQLPDDFMYDGWGRRIDYAVDINFANSDITNPAACLGTSGNACFRDMTAGTITVNDQSSTARTTAAVYVILSHGENGHGSFPKPGSATGSRINGFPSGNPYRNATASAAEFTNAKVDNAGATTAYSATFVMMDYTRVDDGSASDGSSTTRTYFDDQIHYKIKSQIVKAAGASIYESICKTASDIVNLVTTDCTGARDSTQCEAFATEVNSICLQ